MSYNLVDPITGALTKVSGNISSNIIPVNASASNKLVTESELSYSTSETKTGGTWIDGKPIYRKVLTGTVIPSNGSVAISGVSMVTDQYGMLRGSNGLWEANKTGYFQVDYNEQTDSVTYYFSDTSGLSRDWFIVVEYTKTTD